MSVTQDVITPEQLLRRAEAQVPMLRAAAEQCEKDRQVSREVMQALVSTGLFRILQPARFGGLEQNFTVLAQVTAELAKGCGSTGWVFGILAEHQWLVALFDLRAQQDVWDGAPDALVSASYAPAATATPVDGGYRLSGRWGWASGCDHASWHIVGAILAPAGPDTPPASGMLLIPRSDYTIEDDWYTVGMAGTGSKDVVLDDVFVPAHRVVRQASVAEGRSPGALVHQSPLYRLPSASVVTVGTLSPVLGITAGALQSFIEATRDRVSRGGTSRGASRVADFAFVQARVAEAAGNLDAARLLVLRDLDEAYQTVSAGQQLSTEARVRYRRDYALAVQLCSRAVDGLFASSGASGMHLRNAVQRAWRDVSVAARHIGLSWDVNSLPYGQYALGLEPQGQY